MVVAPVLTNVGLGLALPYILNKLSRVGSSAATSLNKGVNPVTGQLVPGAAGGSIPTTMATVGNVLGKGSKVLHGAGKFGQFVIPTALQLASRGAQGAGTAGGALAGAAGQVAGLPLRTNERAKQMFGATSGDRAADAMALLGGAAGVGTKALGDAAAGGLADTAGALRLLEMRQELKDDAMDMMEKIQGMRMDPATASVIARFLTSLRGAYDIK